jgi:hypothetical protein
MKRLFQTAAAILAALFTIRRRSVVLANIAEGQHLASQGITLEADVAITERNLLVKRGGASNRVAICGAADTPIGVCSDEATAVGDLVNMRTFHSDVTIPVVASGAIAQDALLEPAANGRVATLGVGVGTHHVVGRAMNSAANAGDIIEMAPSYFLRVI